MNNSKSDSIRINTGWKIIPWGMLILIACVSRIAVTSELSGNNGSTVDAQQPVEGRVVDTKLQPRQSNVDTVIQPQDEEEFVGEMYQIGLGWHPAALQDLSRDKFGLVDWVASLNEKKINPRGNVDPDVEEVPPFDMDIVMPSKTGLIEGAYFPHKTHTTWLACENCHTKIFMPIAGSNNLTMSRIVEGKACGVCHGKVAFPLNDCERCHVPQKLGSSETAIE